MLPVLALVVSALAAIIALIALWRTHFARGKLLWAAGSASISVTGWYNDGRRWFTPDFAIPMSIANTGAMPVTVRGLRLKVSYPDLPIPGAHEIWDLNHELDLETELVKGKGRTALKAIKGTGTPFVVLQKSVIDKRFLFWCRWEKPVVQSLVLELEALTSRSKKWRRVESWQFKMLPDNWVYLVDAGGRFGVGADGQTVAKFHKAVSPPDLHKYTGPTDPLPSKPREHGPSYAVGTDEVPSVEDFENVTKSPTLGVTRGKR